MRQCAYFLVGAISLLRQHSHAQLAGTGFMGGKKEECDVTAHCLGVDRPLAWTIN